MVPDDVDAWSARWALLHLIEEYPRHAGHADIIRESIDGRSAYLIQAGFETSVRTRSPDVDLASERAGGQQSPEAVLYPAH